MDLDINNYNLDDILNLFKIPADFGEPELKHAKQIVLKTHPDKSRLPSEYFLFYSKAYKTLYSIYTFKNKQNKSINTDSKYDTHNPDSETKNIILDQFFEQNKKIKDPKNFNKWFNKQFEQLHEKEENGYGDWLKKDEDIYKPVVGTKEEQINKYKQQRQSSSSFLSFPIK